MKTLITKGLEPDAAKEMKQHFIGSHILRKRLRELIENEASNIMKEMRSDDTFENPNWENLHANQLGQAKALYKMISWLEN